VCTDPKDPTCMTNNDYNLCLAGTLHNINHLRPAELTRHRDQARYHYRDCSNRWLINVPLWIHDESSGRTRVSRQLSRISEFC
jgi:hypothetical protein